MRGLQLKCRVDGMRNPKAEGQCQQDLDLAMYSIAPTQVESHVKTKRPHWWQHGCSKGFQATSSSSSSSSSSPS